MPVTADSFLWEATGFSASGTSIVVTHPDAGGTTAGSTVVVMFTAQFTMTGLPAGFSAAPVGAANSYVKPNVGAGETSWSFTMASTGSAAWWMAELADVVLIDPVDAAVTLQQSTTSNTNGGTQTAGTTPLNAGSSGVALARLGAVKAGGSDVQSWSGWTNGFTERVDVAPAPGTTGRQIAVAWKAYEGFATVTTTGTFATTAATAATTGHLLMLRSADATINAPLDFCTTFGFGTHAGMGNLAVSGQPTNPLGNVPAIPDGTWGTNYAVGAYGRDGRTGLQITNSGGVVAKVFAPNTLARAAFGGNIAPVSGSGTPGVVYLLLGTTLAALQLVYDVSTEKFGLRWIDSAGVAGTTEWQTGTSPLGGGHVWIDIRLLGDTTTYSCAWSVETGTGDGSQTAPADVAGTAESSVQVWLGAGIGAQTGVFRYSDVVYTRYAGAYPLGPHVVRVLVPETTGATVSGTSTNFSRFTANGTLAAISVDTAGALLDDIPPTVSASSDGVVQTAVAASDYLNFPMTTYTLASDEIVAGVRVFASLWGGTGSGTGTLGFRGYDGTTETTFAAASASFDPDSLTTASATYPLWYASMWGAGTAWNQTKLNAAALRGGFSTDATPDMGFSCMGLEVAVKTITDSWTVHRMTSDEDPEAVAATVTERLHPYNSGVRTYTVSNNDANRTAVFNYSIGGTPQTPVTVAPAAAPVDVTVGAEAFGEVDSTSFGWQ